MKGIKEVTAVAVGIPCTTKQMASDLAPFLDPLGWDSFDLELNQASTSASVKETKADHSPDTSAKDSYPFLAPPQLPDEIGRLGPYRVLKALGEGGMGIVFEAEDPDLKRLVALKTMRPDAASHSVARERFLREARSTAALAHDNIVTIHQVGEDQGVPYLAMELLHGETLESRLKRERSLPAAEVLRIGREVAAGLAAAHERGLIHRDIKPENIWLESARGRVKIVDFGLVLPLQEEGSLSRTGLVVGTPAYMSPEHAVGKTSDPRCDLFSLGCVLYRACAGQLPFKGASPFDVLLAITEQTPKSIRLINPDVPEALDALVMTLLAKIPDDRFPSAQAVVAAIEAVEHLRNDRPSPMPISATPTKKPRRWLIAGAALLFAAVALAVRWNSDPDPVGVNSIEAVDVARLTDANECNAPASEGKRIAANIDDAPSDDGAPARNVIGKRMQRGMKAGDDPKEESEATDESPTSQLTGVSLPPDTLAQTPRKGSTLSGSTATIPPVKPVLTPHPKPVHRPVGKQPHPHPRKP